MPTNLPPDYYDAEKRFRAAQFPAEKAALLEEMISIVPKHKGTDHLRADLRKQLSKLKEEAKSKKKQGGRQSIFYIEKEGAGQAAVIGLTNVGKSALVNALTNASPEVSAAPFTTWAPAPGMMPFENIQFQLVDTPPLDRDFVEPGLMDLIRRTDLILLIVDLQEDPIEQMEKALPLLEEYRIFPPHREGKVETLKRPVFIPTILIVNKWDDESLDELYELCCGLLECDLPLIPVSALTGRNFDSLKRLVYDQLDILRVYAKPPGQEADLEKPFVLKKGSTVVDMAVKIHKDFYENLKAARVWGAQVFDGQMVSKYYVLHEGDVIELRI
jgi:uncharacterized protein